MSTIYTEFGKPLLFFSSYIMKVSYSVMVKKSFISNPFLILFQLVKS